MFLPFFITIGIFYFVFHGTKYLKLKIWNYAKTMLKPSPYSKHVLHFLCMNSSNYFIESTLKYL